MKRIFYILILTLYVSVVSAQTNDKPFKGYLYNEKYRVYLKIDFYDNSVTVPGEDIYGEMAGYFGDTSDGRKWLFTSAKLISPTKAVIEITNDYGSEDLTATLEVNKDGTYTFVQKDGSTLKIARNRKWVKMPKTMTYIKKH